MTENVTGLLDRALGEKGRMETACYGDNMLIARVEGDGFSLDEGWWQKDWHTFVLVYEGELRVTLNGDRVGFDAPVYIDFISVIAWGKLTLVGPFRASFVVVEQTFFTESTYSLRTHVMEQMMQYSQSPFMLLTPAEARNIRRLEEVMVGMLTEHQENIFRQEILQAVTCAWQYEMWGIFFHRQQARHADGTVHWKNAAAQFLFLVRNHCRERHEVGWYARQIGVSPDALSATLKHYYGKTASVILNEILLEEAKTCLRNPGLSIQAVSEMLGFGDQSSFGKFFKRLCGVSPIAYRKDKGG